MIRLMGSLTSLLWESPGGLAGHVDPTHMARGCPQHAALALESLCDTVPYALCLLSYGVRRDKKEKVRRAPEPPNNTEFVRQERRLGPRGDWLTRLEAPWAPPVYWKTQPIKTNSSQKQSAPC